MKEAKELHDLLREVIAFYRGEGEYNFSRLSEYQRDNAYWDAWHKLEYKINIALAE